jgi:hypothetical protein
MPASPHQKRPMVYKGPGVIDGLLLEEWSCPACLAETFYTADGSKFDPVENGSNEAN